MTGGGKGEMKELSQGPPPITNFSFVISQFLTPLRKKKTGPASQRTKKKGKEKEKEKKQPRNQPTRTVARQSFFLCRFFGIAAFSGRGASVIPRRGESQRAKKEKKQGGPPARASHTPLLSGALHAQCHALRNSNHLEAK